MEEEKVAKEHHDLIEARKRLQDTIVRLSNGGAASVQKLRLKLKNNFAKLLVLRSSWPMSNEKIKRKSDCKLNGQTTGRKE